MSKKVLKTYESPVVEILEMDLEGQVLAGLSNPDDGINRPKPRWSRELEDVEAIED
jgi:hypothetical protein